jgi:sterol desaturase/sphingolipid hydroxylase (fatty acid hydroxylase superfamily)
VFVELAPKLIATILFSLCIPAILIFVFERVFVKCSPGAEWSPSRMTLGDLGFWFCYAVVFEFLLGIAPAYWISRDIVAMLDKISIHPIPLHLAPLWIQIAVLFLFFDLLLYLNHRYVSHGIFWRFHRVHHGPPNVTWMLLYRVHPIELLCCGVYRVLTFVVFSADFANSLVWFGVLIAIPGLFAHANFQAKIGHLSRFFVTPQFHRIHHATDPKYHNSNYGICLSLWDFIFGTATVDNKPIVNFGLVDHTSKPKELPTIG